MLTPLPACLLTCSSTPPPCNLLQFEEMSPDVARIPAEGPAAAVAKEQAKQAVEEVPQLVEAGETLD